jgi:glyoxylase-like metal-dependent hydrolase (beta-lactamase superfamily II)
MPQLDDPSRISSQPQTAAPNVYRLPTGISNCYFVALDANDYILIDAGGTGYGDRILQTARELFEDSKPRAILLTHAHFDHAGGLPELLQHWPDVPVYAHPLELPYLNEGRRYPPGDPTVGGMMANMSRFLDTSRPTFLPKRALPLPETIGPLDIMPGWELCPSPGHTPGHVSFWNPTTRILIAGDAITTLNQNRPIAAMTQKPMIATPPPYATYNWHHARQSARALADLEPYSLCTGHGVPMRGPDIASQLKAFTQNFPTPRRGRYVRTPAKFDRHGPTFIPPRPADPTKQIALTTLAVLAGFGLYMAIRSTRPQRA